MAINKTTVLILGPKHSGKTSAGRALADILGMPFIDLDDALEKQTGKSPRALYRESVEAFRESEAQALFEALGTKGAVVAAGGGIADNEAATLFLKQSGDSVIMVFLETPASLAWERVRQSPELPPFLQGDDLETAHRLLHERRNTAYAELAAITIAAGDDTPDELATRIAAALTQRNEPC